MCRSQLLYMPVILLGCLSTLSSANAQSNLPPDRSVFFLIHADSRDPDSPVLISTEVRLTALARESNRVGWNPLWVAITQYDEQGEIVGSWTHSSPIGPARMWWISHQDPMSPTNDEFTCPPELAGVADSDIPNGPTLEYYIYGTNPGTPPAEPYPITAILDYSFQRSDEPEPVDNDEDGPADVPLGDDEPA